MGDELLYTDPNAMEPLFPNDETGKLEHLATELIRKSAMLSGAMNSITRKALADFLRPMNSYYSNLIEGHDTHPIDIERALNNDFSEDKEKRDRQKEARAHIMVHEEISREIKDKESGIVVSSVDYLNSIHKRFYEHLPSSFKEVKSREGETKIVEPGALRTDEVEVGRHKGPYSGSLDLFMDRFQKFYDPESINNRSKTRRIISIAAAHHRLAWIHPYLDGNGRVVRLYSDASFVYEGLDSGGLWSISRGLARKQDEYRTRLANADLTRYNDYDGRGNLSNRMLYEFCEFFLSVAIDQAEYMYHILDIHNMVERIENFVDLMVTRKILKTEARHILTEVFVKGKTTKRDAMRITDTSDKTLKSMTDKLIGMGLITAVKEGINMVYYVTFPVKYSPMLFPGIYPGTKEVEMMNSI